MAFFGVTKEKINTVRPIENADTLDVATLKGMDFPFVIRRGSFAVGDEVLYFPVDSLLPSNVQEVLGVAGRLAGKEKNRVKTIKLRGQISMGIVSDPTLFDIPASVTDITEHLGVTKYEPEEPACKAGRLLPLPVGLSKYDIEGADRYTNIFESLKDEKVIVTEKLEGQNVSFMYDVTDGSFYVNQRNYTIVPIEGQTHDIWKWAIENNIKEKLKAAAEKYSAHLSVTLYGEFVGPGIQGNIYKLKNRQVFMFDLKMDGDFMDHSDLVEVCQAGSLLMVPVIEAGWSTLKVVLDGKTTQEYAHGKSILNPDTLREGVVYRPASERICIPFGRIILKTRDPIYLEKTGN